MFRSCLGRLPLLLATIFLTAHAPVPAHAATFLDVDFDLDDGGFVYEDDPFRGTSQPAFASGAYRPTGGETGGGLEVTVGNVDDSDVTDGMSGGFRIDFVLAQTTDFLEVSFRYNLTQTPDYESDEFSQVIATVDGFALPGTGPDYVVQISGNGNGGSPTTTGWQSYLFQFEQVQPGTYTLVIGAYNNKKTLENESTVLVIDDVLVEGDAPTPCTADPECDDGNACTDDVCTDGFCANAPNTAPCDDGVSCTGNDVCSGGSCSGTDLCLGDASCNASSQICEEPAAQPLVDALSLQNFKDHIEILSSTTGPSGGSRHWSQPGNASALDYLETELESYGYTVERHAYTFNSQTRENVYATRVGTVRPDRMMIVSAHMDSINLEGGGQSFAPGANDDASGTSIVLEAARVFSNPAIDLDQSVRFILWNNEETGLNGSSAYVADRRSLQGIESPAGSGLYPEPSWMGVIQHDMMLWDHGLPSGPVQIPEADNDIEYQASSTFASESLALANLVNQANVDYAPAYPGEVTNDMCCTDSVPFQNDVAAISVRENRRRAEIGNGSDPNWHANSDVFETYSEADFALGFNALQATVGAVAEIVNARQPTSCGDGVLDAGEQCDDGNGLAGDCCSPFCAIEPAGTLCRAATGLCDAADFCDGLADSCPADSVAPVGTSCRPSEGVCDLAEVCDGVSTSCPADAKTTVECRAAVDVCDAAELCDGAGNDCPADAFLPSSTECRAASGDCDVAESCSGVDAACPPDVFQDDGALCSDANLCTTGDLCVAGACSGTGAVDCDDGDDCTADSCDPSNGCVNTPIDGCEPPPGVPTGSNPLGYLLLGVVVLLVAMPFLRHPEQAA
ncbi:MAG: M20/M25/M40 family metallo-hydrolase [bacterium]|nr:M20/M25/M40 family metallo-hydrolase [bacterium]